MGKVVLNPTNEPLLSSQQEAQQTKLYQKGINLYFEGGGESLANRAELKEVLERVKEK